jgi:hypothetical protein
LVNFNLADALPISEYGRGTLRDTQTNAMHIGGSTGGLTHEILEGFKVPDGPSSLRRRRAGLLSAGLLSLPAGT